MNILITGGAGFIGSHLTKYYLQKGASVFVIDNLITGSERNLADVDKTNLKFHNADVSTFDYSSFPEIDIAFHMASPASPIQYKKHPVETLMSNSYGTHRLLDLMKEGKVKSFVLASTSEIYGDPLEHPQKETYWGNVHTLGPRACYDEAKRFAEAMTSTYRRKFNLNTRIARIFNTYGPFMEVNDGRVVSNFINQAIKNKPITIYGKGEQTRSFCYVSDLVRGLIALGEQPHIDGEVINLGNPEEKTVSELAEIIKKMTQSNSEIIYESIDQDDPKRRKPDISKAQFLLHWQPEVPLEKGLSDTITYFRSILQST